MGRLAGRKNNCKVIYTAHGFHFYKGAPLINWLLYYPVEKWLARYTDALITINQEDYDLARRKMKLRKGGKVYYVPGVGIDSEKFGKASIDKGAKRRELGIPEDAVLLLSVGELNQNKNHETVIRAIADMNVYYVIAGTGESQQYLESLIDTHNLQDRVKLLGFRNDVKELYEASDIFVFPSFREGLSVAVMESMASGLPCVISRIRGNVDLIEDGVNGFLCDPRNALEFAEKIALLANNAELREKMGRTNRMVIQQFSTDIVIQKMQDIYAAELLGSSSK
jgi:glycosyltransferase involved in cell wall biosynthesis